MEDADTEDSVCVGQHRPPCSVLHPLQGGRQLFGGGMEPPLLQTLCWGPEIWGGGETLNSTCSPWMGKLIWVP